MTQGHLVLADGAVFTGVSVGADGVSTGEVVFNTAMTGHQEVCTDPSYAGQIVAMTAPHIGNYGINLADAQSARPACAGFLMRAATRHEVPCVTTAQGGLAVARSIASGPAASAPVASLQRHHGGGSGRH